MDERRNHFTWSGERRRYTYARNATVTGDIDLVCVCKFRENLTMPSEDLLTFTQSSDFGDIGFLTQNFHSHNDDISSDVISDEY